MSEELSMLNTLARRQAATKAPEPTRTDSPGMLSMLLEVQGQLREARATNASLLEAMESTDSGYKRQLDELRAQLAEANTARAVAESKCSMHEAKPAEADDEYEAKYESACAELIDLKVAHAACGARIDAANRECSVLRDQLASVNLLLQAKEPEEPETEEPETEEATGCEIDVVRGGDDRIRSLKVRYTK